MHHIGRTDVDDRIAVVAEDEGAGVFEEASEYGTDGDVLTQSFDARAQGADSADEDFDGDAGL